MTKSEKIFAILLGCFGTVFLIGSIFVINPVWPFVVACTCYLYLVYLVIVTWWEQRTEEKIRKSKEDRFGNH